jgi:hypothetical protein
LGLGETAARRSFFFACGILANVYFWPLADIQQAPANVRFWGKSGHGD